MHWSMDNVKAQRRNAVYTNVSYPPFNIQGSNPGNAKSETLLPIDFRTLSINVETEVDKTAAKKKNARHKRAIKGEG